jgi:hypothetical protein
MVIISYDKYVSYVLIVYFVETLQFCLLLPLCINKILVHDRLIFYLAFYTDNIWCGILP